MVKQKEEKKKGLFVSIDKDVADKAQKMVKERNQKLSPIVEELLRDWIKSTELIEKAIELKKRINPSTAEELYNAMIKEGFIKEEGKKK